MRYLSLPSTDPHYNMAFDEFALQGLDLEEPVFYLWQNRPSVIIGLNQSPYAEVNLPFLEEKGIVLARRVTGGGAVYHDLQNLNYTITGRARDLQAAYPEYLHLVIDALRRLGVAAGLSGRNDILVDGRKCSGFAKRLWKDRLMVHGTLMYDVDIDTLTRALAVPGSKLAAAGIASVRSRVANLRAYLPAFSGIDSFRTALQGILSGGDGEILLTAAQKAAVARDADTRGRKLLQVEPGLPGCQFARTGDVPHQVLIPGVALGGHTDLVQDGIVLIHHPGFDKRSSHIHA